MSNTSDEFHWGESLGALRVLSKEMPATERSLDSPVALWDGRGVGE